MKRRNKSEIQIQNDVPDYSHESLSSCRIPGDSSNKADTVNIYYNAKYRLYTNGSQGTPTSANYHRDNYCAIPLMVSSMTINNNKAWVPKAINENNIPPISTWKGVDYDYNLLIKDDIHLLSILGADFTDSMLNNADIAVGPLYFCACRKGSVHSGAAAVYPLDSLTTLISSVSDEYAYSWPDDWDMATLYVAGRGRSKTKKDQSSSSSVPPPPSMGSLVYLCTVTAAGPGTGGASIVAINGKGGTASGGGGSITGINFPGI